MNEEISTADVKMTGILDKYEGDPAPENLIERVYVEEDKIVKTEFFENGKLVATQGGE